MNRRKVAITMLTALGATSAHGQNPPVPAPAPQNVRDARAVLAAAPKARIGNGRLSLVLLLPDREKGFYRGTRFDWSGIISSAMVDGQEYYGLWFDRMGDNIRDFIVEGDVVIAGPNTALLGPAEAFDTSNPPGWADAASGQGFLKIGVGVLRKPGDGAAYSSFRLYDVIDHGKWEMARGRRWIRFTHRLTDQSTGFGYVYAKTIRLASDSAEMTIEHALTNTGQRPIASSMFNHNFLTFGGTPTARLPRVTAPYPIEAAAPPRGDAATLVDGGIQYQRPLAGQEIFSMPIKGFRDIADARFTVRDARGAAVTIVSDRPWSRLMLWSINRLVAMEPFVALSVAPGETTQWSSRYQFDPPGKGPPS